jgi:hypothetical protein
MRSPRGVARLEAAFGPPKAKAKESDFAVGDRVRIVDRNFTLYGRIYNITGDSVWVNLNDGGRQVFDISKVRKL